MQRHDARTIFERSSPCAIDRRPSDFVTSPVTESKLSSKEGEEDFADFDFFVFDDLFFEDVFFVFDLALGATSASESESESTRI